MSDATVTLGIELETFSPWEPRFDSALGQYVALTLGGIEVYGDTLDGCAQAWAEHLEIEAAHEIRDPMGLDCAVGPCWLCDPIVRGKCDWRAYHVGD